MAHLPMQVPWRDFVCVLRELGYAAQKGKAGSKRYFVNPARNPTSVSFNEPHPGDNLRQNMLRIYLQELQLTEDEFLRLLDNR
jgi:predicted RNA binding protein YcfA (HicA-like mRNA interferase family)